jgi:hypothetical protein
MIDLMGAGYSNPCFTVISDSDFFSSAVPLIKSKPARAIKGRVKNFFMF